MSKTTAAGIFLLKCVTFSVIFIAVWLLGFGPLSAAQSPADRATADHKARTDEYDNQTRQVAQQLLESAAQQRRMAALLTAQEAQNVRYEAVLQRWEEQTGVCK
jgi:Fe-S cluster assembly scaffold protein SufB